MPKSEVKTLSYPLGGVAQRAVTRNQRRPYTAAWAYNVRSVCSLDTRLRGGSRPGMSKVSTTDFGAAISSIIPVTYKDSDGNRQNDVLVVAGGILYVLRGSTGSFVEATLETPGGVTILAEDGQEIVFDSTVTSVAIGGSNFDVAERFGKLFLADSSLREYNPVTGVVTTPSAAAGVIPTGQSRCCLYRDRIFLAGEDNVWYCSRQGDPYDWDFGADLNDVGRAVAGQVGVAGRLGGTVTALIPWEDSSLVFATADELWLLQGEPTSGGLQRVANSVGIIASGAWDYNPDGAVCFLSRDGLYLMNPGSPGSPKRFSYDKLPEKLIDVDTTTNHVQIAYDAEGKGFHLFITPYAGTAGEHWWVDVENESLWPVAMPTAMQPMAASRRNTGSELREVLIGGADGYLRKFDDSVVTDDGTAIKSHVLIGPFRVGTNDMMDGAVAEIQGIMATGSGAVDWRIVMGDTSEAVIDIVESNMQNSINGGKINGVCASGEFVAGRNRVSRPRCRGGWCGIWLSSAKQWAYEAIAVKTLMLGRLRNGY